MNPTTFNILVGVAGLLSVVSLIKKEWSPLLAVGLLLVCVALIVGPGKP